MSSGGVISMGISLSPSGEVSDIALFFGGENLTDFDQQRGSKGLGVNSEDLREFK